MVDAAAADRVNTAAQDMLAVLEKHGTGDDAADGRMAGAAVGILLGALAVSAAPVSAEDFLEGVRRVAQGVISGDLLEPEA